MEGTNIRFRVGGTFKQDDTILRVIATKGDEVLLEQWKGNELIQYIVTNGLFVEHNELHWYGSGTYFPCMYPPPTCDTPYVALRKAMDYLQGPRRIYLLIGYSDGNAWADMYSTMAETKAALQKCLDLNENIQSAVAKLGVGHLTADAYLDYEIQGALDLCDTYIIDERDYI